MKHAHTTTKKSPIYAAMQFTYPGTKNNKMHVVGYKLVRFFYDSPEKDCLIDEKEIKRSFIN